jgi:hypothetical protein
VAERRSKLEQEYQALRQAYQELERQLLEAEERAAETLALVRRRRRERKGWRWDKGEEE